jgi:hypothetical protein
MNDIVHFYNLFSKVGGELGNKLVVLARKADKFKA